jgi:5-methylcytosine-specific restriction protein A
MAESCPPKGKCLKENKMKRKDNPSDQAKLRVLRLCGYKCSYCGVSGSEAELEIDHIIPISKGGSNHLANLTTACRSCNQSKSDSLDFTATKKHIETKNDPSSLVGLFVLVLKDEQVEYQGEIIKQAANFVVINLFSWWSGKETGSTLIVPIYSIFTDDNYLIYSTQEGWNKKAAELMEIRNQKSRQRLEEMMKTLDLEKLQTEAKDNRRSN